MNGSRVLSSTDMTSDASPVVATDVLLARILLGLLCVAAVAVLSLPQARAASAAFGWMPLWLLATPLSAWLALQLRRRVLSADVDAAPLRHRRRRRPRQPAVAPATGRAACAASAPSAPVESLLGSFPAVTASARFFVGAPLRRDAFSQRLEEHRA